jgi:hypothetical protein
MESKGSTRVVRLDGSRAMRSTTTNEMNDMLDVCILEHIQGEEQNVGKQEVMNYMRDSGLHARKILITLLYGPE